MTVSLGTHMLRGTPQSRADYELPPQGSSITEWVARRLHKTELLAAAGPFVAKDPATALAYVGLYAAAASSSYGPARYQPRFDAPGRVVTLRDPLNNARTEVHYEGQVPHYRFSYRVSLDGIGEMTGAEEITGTTVGLRGLGMPAPSVFRFQAAHSNYTAEAKGTITSELAPRIGTWRIRAYGDLQLRDSAGNRGTVRLERNGHSRVDVTRADGSRVEMELALA